MLLSNERFGCPTEQWPPLRFDDVAAHKPFEKVAHVVIVKHREHSETNARDKLVDVLRILAVLQPLAGHACSADFSELVVNDLVREKVLLDKRAQPVPNFILLV